MSAYDWHYWNDEDWDDFYNPYHDEWGWDDNPSDVYDDDYYFNDDPYDAMLRPRGRGNVERKHELDKAKLIHCGHCPYHRRDNITHHFPRDDRHKNHQRMLKQAGIVSLRGWDAANYWDADYDDYWDQVAVLWHTGQ